MEKKEQNLGIVQELGFYIYMWMIFYRKLCTCTNLVLSLVMLYNFEDQV